MSNSQLSDANPFEAGEPFHIPARQKPRRTALQPQAAPAANASKTPAARTAKRQVRAGGSAAAPTRERRGIELTRNTTSALVSLIVHTVLFVILLSLAVTVGGGNSLSLQIDSGAAAREESPADLDVSLDLPAVSSSSLQPVAEAATAPASSASSADVAVQPEAAVADLGRGPAVPTVAGTEIGFLGSGEADSLLAPVGPMFSGHSLEGRSPGDRAARALANGGSRETEAAVEAALRWLAIHQYPDGGWSTVWSTVPTAHPECRGQCSLDSEEEMQPKRTAATGLALLAFLGAGYTHKEGKYQEEVYAGLRYLMETMKYGKPNDQDRRSPGQWVDNSSSHRMYEQGIAAFALCEAYEMTDDPSLRESAQLAALYICGAQNYDGSWGYFPGESGDLSINGWQMLALRSASAGGLAVSPEVVRRTDRFLDSRAFAGGPLFYYRPPRGVAVPEMTAIGALMRLMRGTSPTDPRITKAIEYVVYRSPGPRDDGPEATDVYFNYYASNLLFYAQSPHWPEWNERMKSIYLNSQATEGHEAGSWFKANPETFEGFSSSASDNGLNLIGGRLYTTAMAAMTLEVYYRYLPIQKNPEQIDFEL